jgi:hypothetical protein
MAETEAQRNFEAWLETARKEAAERQQFYATANSSYTADQLFTNLNQWGRRRWAGAAGSFEEVQDNILQDLRNLGEVDPSLARMIANGWMDRAGDVSGVFKARITGLEAEWQRAEAAEQAAEKAEASAIAAARATGQAYVALAPSPKGKKRPNPLLPEVPSPSIVSRQEPEEPEPQRPSGRLIVVAGRESTPGDDPITSTGRPPRG